MVRTHQEVPERTKNSVTIQLNKLIRKYGKKEVRLIVMRIFQGISERDRLESEIAQRESELVKLKKSKS